MDGDLARVRPQHTTKAAGLGRTVGALALAGALLAGLAACGSSGGSDASSDPGTTTSAAARTTTPVKAPATTTTTTGSETTTTGGTAGGSTTCTIDYGSMAWSGTDKEMLASNEKAQEACSKLFDTYPIAAFGGIALPALLGDDTADEGEGRAAELRRLHAEGFKTLTITVRGKGCEDVAGGGSIEYVVVSDPAKPTPFTEARLRKGVASLQPGGTFAPADGGIVATLPEKAGDTTCPVAWAIKGRAGALVIAPSNDVAATTAKRLVG